MLTRDATLFLKCLASSLVLLILVGAVCLIGALAISGNTNNIAINVAVVDNEDSVISRILINAVKSTDYLSKFLRIEKTDESSATSAVKDGNASAAIILPKNFVGDILSGKQAKGKIYISDSVESYSGMVASAARFGEKLLVAGQYVVFTGEHIIKQHNLGASYHSEFLKTINNALISEALNARDKYIEPEKSNYLDTGMATSSYFAMCWLLTLLFLISIFFSELFTKDMSRGMLSRLSAYKIRTFRFFLPKITLMFLFRMAVILIALALIPDMGKITLSILFFAILTALYISIVGACLSLCFGDNVSANAITAIGGMFLCGGIVPRQLLPGVVTALGDFTPFGAAKLLVQPIFGASPSFSLLLPALVYLLISIILINRKFSRVLSGGGL